MRVFGGFFSDEKVQIWFKQGLGLEIFRPETSEVVKFWCFSRFGSGSDRTGYEMGSEWIRTGSGLGPEGDLKRY